MIKCKFLLVFLFLIASSISLLAQDKTITGTIVSADDNTPLQGVSVRVLGSKKGVQTNEAGYYSIVAAKGVTIQFTYISYAQQTHVVGDETTYSIKLVETSKELGNVVVTTAYGIKKNKTDLNSAVTVIQGDDVAQTRRENFINSLAGRIPGATITATTGMPGASSSIILRGPTSIDGNNQPIFVVDGLIIDNSSFEMQDRLPAASAGGVSLANARNDFGNRAMDMNPEDMETITVLKGPEATALYGSDGANGAIVITTKKGKKGRANVSYNANFSWSKVYRLPEIQTTYDQGNSGVSNQNVRQFFGQKYAPSAQLYDNIGSFFRVGKSQQHNLSIDGGNDMGTYRFTASYSNQAGVVPNTGFKRYNFRLNNTYKISPKVNVTSSFSYINSRTDKASKGSGGFLISLLSWPLDDDIRNYTTSSGTRRVIRANINDGVEDDNPFWDVNKNINNDINDRINGNVGFSYDPTKWLNLNVTHGVDFYTTKSTWFLHPQSNLARTANGIIYQWNENQRLINGVYRATLKKKFGKFNNTLVTAFTFDTRKYEINSVKGERFFDPTFVSINNVDPTSIGSLTTISNWNRAGAFAVYNGTYDSWLNFSASYRQDYSSRLVDPVYYKPADVTYGYYSVGGNVLVTELIKTLPKAIQLLKLRVNYATTGRDPSSPYVKGNRFQQSTLTGGGFQPFVTQGNPDLKAEYSKQFETGLELTMLKNRLSLDFAFYRNRTENQLINPRLSYASGAILKWLNGGTVQNKGFEFALKGTPLKYKNLVWDITVNFARNRNKILEMPAGLPQFYNSDTYIGAIRNIAIQGGSIYQLSADKFQRNTNGDLIINQLTGIPLQSTVTTLAIASGEAAIAGDREPDFNIGLINSFTIFKNVSLSFNLDIRKGGDVFNGTEEFLYRNGLSTRTLERETPRIIKGVLNDGLQNTTNPTQNTILINPLFRSDYYSGGVATEDFIEKNINWVRLRDLSLSYNIPNKFVKRQKIIKGASFTFTGTDLFILTNYSGADPSANANNTSTRGGIGGVGLDFGNLATPRGFNFSFRLQF
jgi:ferric enterobactin receptor